MYYFDTYAIIELTLKNPRYLVYGDFPLITSALNKAEIYWWALTRHGQRLADILLDSIPASVEITDNLIRQAMIFRHMHKKSDISVVDAIGYTYAQRNGLRFLTGDKAFKNVPGVEYVPAS